MKKLIFILILTLTLLFMLALSLSAKSYLVDDRYDYLSSAEEIAVENALEAAYTTYGAKIYVGIGYDTLYDNYSSFLYNNDIYESDIIILLIELDGGVYYYKMHLVGDPTNKITLSEENSVLDNSSVYDNIKSGNLKEGISSFASLIGKAYATVDYTPVFVGGCIALVLGAVIFIIVVITKYKKKQRGDTYPFDEFTTFELTHHSDVLMNKTLTRVRINRSRGGGGGGGGGGSRSSSRR